MLIFNEYTMYMLMLIIFLIKYAFYMIKKTCLLGFYSYRHASR